MLASAVSIQQIPSCMPQYINWPCAWDIRYSHFVRRFSKSDFTPLFKGCMDCQDRKWERGILYYILVPKPDMSPLPTVSRNVLSGLRILMTFLYSCVNTDESWGISQELFISVLMHMIQPKSSQYSDKISEVSALLALFG